MPARAAFARFIEKVEKTGTGTCWLWTASLQSHHGYGQFWDGKRLTTAHEFSYRYFNGPTRNKRGNRIHIHHTCEVKRCVNPAHLEQTTARRNIRISSKQAKSTHCPRGHKYDYVVYTNGKFRCRRCSKCDYARNKAKKYWKVKGGIKG